MFAAALILFIGLLRISHSVAARPVERKGVSTSYDTQYGSLAFFESAQTTRTALLQTEFDNGTATNLLSTYGPQEVHLHTITNAATHNFTIRSVTIISRNSTVVNHTLSTLVTCCETPRLCTTPLICVNLATMNVHGSSRDPLTTAGLTSTPKDILSLYQTLNGYQDLLFTNTSSLATYNTTAMVIWPPGGYFNTPFQIGVDSFVNFDTDGGNYHNAVIEFGHNTFTPLIDIRYEAGQVYVAMSAKIPPETPYISTMNFMVTNMKLPVAKWKQQSFRPHNGTRCSYSHYNVTLTNNAEIDPGNNNYVHPVLIISCSIKGWNRNGLIAHPLGDYVFPETHLNDDVVRLTQFILSTEFKSYIHHAMYPAPGTDLIIPKKTNSTHFNKGIIRRDVTVTSGDEGSYNGAVIGLAIEPSVALQHTTTDIVYGYTYGYDDELQRINIDRIEGQPNTDYFGILFINPFDPSMIVGVDDGSSVIVTYIEGTDLGYIEFTDAVSFYIEYDLEFAILSVHKDSHGKPLVLWGEEIEQGNGTVVPCKNPNTDLTMFNQILDLDLTPSDQVLCPWLTSIGITTCYLSVSQSSHNPCDGGFVYKATQRSRTVSYTIVVLILVGTIGGMILVGLMFYCCRKYIIQAPDNMYNSGLISGNKRSN